MEEQCTAHCLEINQNCGPGFDTYWEKLGKNNTRKTSSQKDSYLRVKALVSKREGEGFYVETSRLVPTTYRKDPATTTIPAQQGLTQDMTKTNEAEGEAEATLVMNIWGGAIGHNNDVLAKKLALCGSSQITALKSSGLKV